MTWADRSAIWSVADSWSAKRHGALHAREHGWTEECEESWELSL